MLSEYNRITQVWRFQSIKDTNNVQLQHKGVGTSCARAGSLDCNSEISVVHFPQKSFQSAWIPHRFQLQIWLVHLNVTKTISPKTKKHFSLKHFGSLFQLFLCNSVTRWLHEINTNHWAKFKLAATLPSCGTVQSVRSEVSWHTVFTWQHVQPAISIHDGALLPAGFPQATMWRHTVLTTPPTSLQSWG